MTALAGLENNYITGSTVVDDNGYIELAGQKFENSEGAVNGPISLVHAIEVSSDVFFYKLGARMWNNNDLQNWSRKMGIGDPTGIDIPTGPSAEGLVPSKKWRDELFENEEPNDRGRRAMTSSWRSGRATCRPIRCRWRSPTRRSATGDVVTPHLGKEVMDTAGRVLKEIDPGPRRHVKIKPETRQEIMEGLHLATSGPGGTATPVFKEFPIEIAGKTGTAERAGHPYNMSWFISLAPYPNPNIVTVVVVEEGGFGADRRPAARQILETYFHKTLKQEAEEETKKSETSFEGEAPVEETFEEVEGVPGEEAFEEEAPVEEAGVEETGVGG